MRIYKCLVTQISEDFFLQNCTEECCCPDKLQNFFITKRSKKTKNINIEVLKIIFNPLLASNTLEMINND